MSPNRTLPFFACGFLLFALPAARREADACALLTTADASKALEASSVPGKRLIASTPAGCVWSNDPAASDTSRRIIVVTHSIAAFKIATHPAITTIKVEPVSGIGDEAFFQVYPATVFLWVRKGTSAFSIQIQTGTRPAPFTPEEKKSKELALAKAVTGRL